MASSYLNMLDIAKINSDPKLIEMIEENLNTAPEVRIIPAKTVPQTSYTTLIRTAFPQPGFRAVNEGTDTLKSTYATKLVECFYLDGQLEIDVAAAQACSDGEDYAKNLEASGVVQGSMLKLGTQLYYGTGSLGDSKGFPGALQVVDSSLVTDAGGTTESTCSSVYGFKLGSQFVNFVFGRGNVLSMGQWQQQFVTRNSKESQAWKNAINGWVGVQFVHKYSVGRIKKLTEDVGKKLTDTLIGQWLAKFPVGVRPDVLFMSRRSSRQLQESRSATSITNASPKQANGLDVWAPQPTSSNGIPIVVTDSLLDTETLAL